MNQEKHTELIGQILKANNIDYYILIPQSHGANNAVYKILRESAPLVAKVGINSSFRYLHREYEFLQSVPDIGPEPLLFDTDTETGTQIIIQTFVEGIHPFRLDGTYLKILGNKISSYHSNSFNSTSIQCENWLWFMDNRIPRISPSNQHPLKNDIESLLVTLKDSGLKIYNNEPQNPPVPVHGDLIPLNIILEPDTSEIKIIDWEGVRFDDAEADLATCIKAYNISGERLEALLEGYGKEIRPKILWFRLLLHYLQVICWRIECHIPSISADAKNDAESEVTDELNTVMQLLSRGYI